MSLTDFIKQPDVTERLKILRPHFTRKIPVPIKVKPEGKNAPIIGAAFDYFLRFEIQRLFPKKTKSSQWVAEHASLLISQNPSITDRIRQETNETSIKKIAIDVHTLVEKTKTNFNEFLVIHNPTKSDYMNIAKNSIILATLDLVIRTGVLYPNYNQVDMFMATELVDLINAVPFDKLLDGGEIYLNPTFDHASSSVGGADADLICGKKLIEIKTTKESIVLPQYLDQLLGYFLLARKYKSTDASFPTIEKLCIYFSRHGYLLELDINQWTSNENFTEFEKWFFERAVKYLNSPS